MLKPYTFALKDEVKISFSAMGSTFLDEQPVLSPEYRSFPVPPKQNGHQPKWPPAMMATSQDSCQLAEGKSSSSSIQKIKARPILDANTIPLPGGESVNSSQLDLRDIHILKISQISMRIRTCKRFGIGDVNKFLFRLHIDATTTGLIGVLYRRGGLGSEGKVFELWSTVAGMGLKQLTALVGHVRYQISLTLEDKIADNALQEAYVVDI